MPNYGRSFYSTMNWWLLLCYTSETVRYETIIKVFSINLAYIYFLFTVDVICFDLLAHLSKAHVSYSDQNLSIVRCLGRRCCHQLFTLSLTFHIFIIFSRTTGPISTKLGTKHPQVKGIQVCSNEGPHLFPRGDNYEIAKYIDKIKKILFSRTTGLISTKLDTKHPWVK